MTAFRFHSLAPYGCFSLGYEMPKSLRASLLRICVGVSAKVMEQFDVVRRQLAAIAERCEYLRTGKRKHR